jgi:hypothetical protein
MHFANLAADKKKMELAKMNRTEQAELLGILFAREDLLTPRQATIVKKLMNKPNFFYGGGSDSLWTYYNYVSEALQDTHPIRWLVDQRFFHEFIRDFMDLDNVDPTTGLLMSSSQTLQNSFFNGEDPLAGLDNLIEDTPVDPNQVSLEDAIAEVESEDVKISPERQEEWDQQTRIEEGLDHKGEFTPEITIEEQIAEDEAAVSKVCGEAPESVEEVSDHYDLPLGSDDMNSCPEVTEEDEIDVKKLKITPDALDLADTMVPDDDDFDFESDEEEQAEADFDF